MLIDQCYNLAAVRIRLASLDVRAALEQSFRDSLERRLKDCDVCWVSRELPAQAGTVSIFLHQPEQRLDAQRVSEALSTFAEGSTEQANPGAPAHKV